MEEMNIPQKPHTLFIDNRTKLDLTGVTDAASFDDENLLIETTAGRMSLKGENLQITKLSLDTGEMRVEGTVNEIRYSAPSVKTGGFFGKVFG
ncbi:MAG: sporulation protein YabP [Clostridia bacterium]|nr:sporulation protein YabP [Clostridia bacterium]